MTELDIANTARQLAARNISVPCPAIAGTPERLQQGRTMKAILTSTIVAERAAERRYRQAMGTQN